MLGAAIVAGFVLMLAVDHLQGGADHMPAVAHDSDDEEALLSTGHASRAYSSAAQLEVPTCSCSFSFSIDFLQAYFDISVFAIIFQHQRCTHFDLQGITATGSFSFA